MFKAYREKAFEQLEFFQDQARAWWNQLNQREKLILGAAAGLFVAATSAFLIKTLGTAIIESSQRADRLRDNSRAIQNSIVQVVETRNQARSYDNYVSANQDLSSLEEFIQRQAGRFGVSLASVSPTKAETPQGLKTETVSLQLGADANLQRSVAFLEGVQSRMGVRLETLDIKADSTNRQKLLVQAVFSRQVHEEEEGEVKE